MFGCLWLFFFFKEKTAYEMRISDWSSDVCSSDLEPAHYQFEEQLWEKLAHRIPAMEQLRLLRSWAGHYEMNLLDHNGIVGAHDVITNFLLAPGFSGHGVMHSPATGRGIAELIMHGRYTALDVTPLGYERTRHNNPILKR